MLNRDSTLSNYFQNTVRTLPIILWYQKIISCINFLYLKFTADLSKAKERVTKERNKRKTVNDSFNITNEFNNRLINSEERIAENSTNDKIKDKKKDSKIYPKYMTDALDKQVEAIKSSVGHVQPHFQESDETDTSSIADSDLFSFPENQVLATFLSYFSDNNIQRNNIISL